MPKREPKFFDILRITFAASTKEKLQRIKTTCHDSHRLERVRLETLERFKSLEYWRN